MNVFRKILAILLTAAITTGASGANNIKLKPAPPDPPNEGVATDTWAVKLEPGADADALAAQLGAENLGQIGTLENTYLFRLESASEVSSMAVALENSQGVQWVSQQFARQQYPRPIADPLYSDQWHLNNTGQSGGTSGEDANIASIWNTYTGSGVTIGIVDDGLQHTHPDLSAHYVASSSYDFNDGDTDPTPIGTDGHGTSAGGVAAGDNDGASCGVGVAYDAGLAGLRLIAGPSTDAMEASALTYDYNNISIFSNSWGPADDGAHLESPGTLTQAALLDGVTNGRNGLGSIYVWAAGNGLENSDNVNYDGYANSRFTIAVGAVDHDGVQSYYSEPGAAMLITAPSNGDGVGITTTDLLGTDGYDLTDCTDDFGGTSSAAPLVSGAIALMLDANPGLGWRDVQHILIETADKNDPTDPDWTTNGAGYNINHKYGFGRIDVEEAVNTAAAWTNVIPAIRLDSGIINVNQTIPDNNTTGVTSLVNIPQNITLEHVEVVFDAAHPFRGDLKVVLTSPSGTESVLSEPHEDGNANYNSWKFMTVRNWGESSMGTWSIKVTDEASIDQGTFKSWQLIFYGTVNGAGTQTFQSIGANDGWILESSETSTAGGTMNNIAKSLSLGDDAQDRQYRAILHFDTSALPDTAVITSAILQLRKQGASGTNPFTILGSLRVDSRRPSFGTSALQLTDFAASAARKNISTFSPTPDNNWYSAVINISGMAYIYRTGTTQFKIYFTTGDNDDLGTDVIRFYSGNAGVASRPNLVIQYYVP